MINSMQIKALITKANNIFVTDFIAAIRSKNLRVLQPIVLFSSMILSMALTFLSSIFTARGLGPINYGDYKYIITVWSLLTLIMTFGLFTSGSRTLVLESDLQKSRQISGTIILISIIMGMIISLLTALIAYPLDYLFHVNVSDIMTPLAPLTLILPLSQSLYLILQSTNQIYLLALLTAAPSIVYLVFIIVLSAIKQITVITVLLSQQFSSLLIILIILVSIKPSLNSFKYWWNEIKKHHKTYGFPVYLGSLAGVGSTYINRLSISYWVDNTAIGFFSLASSLVEPLKLLPNAVATSSFRSFATRAKISKKILLSTIILTLTSFVVAIFFFGKPLSWIYTTKFQEVGPMARALGLGSIFLGFGDLFNRFLGAHGKGKSLRSAAYANGIATVACILIFVPLIGAWGAVIAVIVPNGIYLFQMYLSYRKYSQTIVNDENWTSD